jgi:hypothetical protein
LVVVEDDGALAEAARLGERLVARRAAIHRDEEARAPRRERPDRLHVGAVPFRDAVGDVDLVVDAAVPQIPPEQRRGAGAVHVVIAEDRDPLTAGHRVGEAGGGPVHVLDGEGIGQEVAQLRREERGHLGQATPRPARTRASTSGTPCAWAIATASCAPCASQRSRQTRPQCERATPRNGRGIELGAEKRGLGHNSLRY